MKLLSQKTDGSFETQDNFVLFKKSCAFIKAQNKRQKSHLQRAGKTYGYSNSIKLNYFN